MALRPARTICTACPPVIAPRVATYSSVVNRRHSRSAPRRRTIPGGELLMTKDYVAALGAMTGGQAMQMVRAGLKAIYLSAGRWPRTRTCRPHPVLTRAFSR